MAEKHAVVRTDLMYGTDVRAGLVSIKYMGEDGETPTAIDNGNVLKVGPLMENEREVHLGQVPAADDNLEEIVLVDTPEVMYDERKHNLDEFFNHKNRIARGYVLHPRDIFSVTADALEGTPEVGKTVTLAAGTKLEVDGSGTSVGTIIEEEVVGQYTYYAIRVD